MDIQPSKVCQFTSVLMIIDQALMDCLLDHNSSHLILMLIIIMFTSIQFYLIISFIRSSIFQDFVHFHSDSSL